jgi:hypothetical protein
MGVSLITDADQGLNNELEEVFRRWYPRFRDRAA